MRLGVSGWVCQAPAVADAAPLFMCVIQTLQEDGASRSPAPTACQPNPRSLLTLLRLLTPPPGGRRGAGGGGGGARAGGAC